MKIYKSGNYIIIEDGISIMESAINRTVYQDTPTSFDVTTKDTNEIQLVRILNVDLIANLWEDDLGVIYTVATMLTFLRGNTGFNSVSGGSGTINSITNTDGLITVSNGTGPIVNLDLNVTLHNRTTYVDVAYGNDTTGLIEDVNKPFLTINAAISASPQPGLIYIRPGTYNEVVILRDNVDIYCSGFVIVSKITDGGEGVLSNVYGDGNLSFSGNGAIEITGPGSLVSIDADVSVSDGVNVLVEQHVTPNELTLNLRKLVVNDNNYLATVRGLSSFTLNCSEQLVHTTTASNYMIQFRNDYVGQTIIRAPQIIGNGRLVQVESDCVSGGGSVFIDADYINNTGDTVVFNRGRVDVDVRTTEMKYTGNLLYTQSLNSKNTFQGGQYNGQSRLFNLNSTAGNVYFNDIIFRNNVGNLFNLIRLSQGDIYIDNCTFIVNGTGTSAGSVLTKTTDSLNSRAFIKNSDFILLNCSPTALTFNSSNLVDGEIYFKNVNSTHDNNNITDMAIVSGFIANDTGLNY